VPVMRELMRWIEEGKLNPAAGQSFSLANAGQAMMKILNREALGKIVITQ
jgi:NADPH:quinone reductase-like Zn-dependent oxidoreductase